MDLVLILGFEKLQKIMTPTKRLMFLLDLAMDRVTFRALNFSKQAKSFFGGPTK